MLLLAACGAASAREATATPRELSLLRIEPPPFHSHWPTALPTGFFRRASPMEFVDGRAGLEADALREPAAPMQWEIRASSLVPGAQAANAPEADESVSARCAAAEYTRHLLERGQAPTPMLQRFIEARCGRDLLWPLRYQAQTFTMTETPDAAALFASWLPDSGGDVARVRLQEGARIALGVAFDSGLPEVTNESASPTEARVVLVVPASPDVMQLRARITHGATGVAECQSTYEARRFHVRCPYDATDASEVIELVGLDSYDIHFGTTQLLVVRDPASLRTFETHAPCGTAEELSVSVAERINAARASLGLAPLVYEAAQSAMNRLLTYAQFEFHYEVSFHYNPGLPRDVAIAGWEVPATLADGHVLTVETPLGACADAMTARLLRAPSERDILLSRTATHLAIGVRFGPGSQQSIVTTYDAFEPLEPEVARERVITLMQQERARRGEESFALAPLPAPLTWAFEQLAQGANVSATFRRAREDLGAVPEGTTLFVYASPTPSAPPYGNFRQATTLAVAATSRRLHAGARGEYLTFVLVGP